MGLTAFFSNPLTSAIALPLVEIESFGRVRGIGMAQLTRQEVSMFSRFPNSRVAMFQLTTP